MASLAQDSYLATGVKTATPQKLQWLLIEAALRSANRARDQWRQGRDDLAIGAIAHAQSVVGQMLATIDRNAGGELASRVSSVYEFIFRSLVKAGHRRDEACLADAIRILEIERETWRQLCEKIAADQGANQAPPPPAAPHVPFGVSVDSDVNDFAGGFSLEA
jgi:flagellar secretion chaperone FliS